jgi:hypothetical protein
MPAPESSPFVGTWNVSLDLSNADPPATDSSQLHRIGAATLHADGTVTASGSPVYAMPEGAPWPRVYVGTCHGAWESTGERTAMIAVRAILRSESGEHLGTLDYYLSAQLGDDDRGFTGTYSTFIAAPNPDWGWENNPRGSVRAWKFRIAPPG